MVQYSSRSPPLPDAPRHRTPSIRAEIGDRSALSRHFREAAEFDFRERTLLCICSSACKAPVIQMVRFQRLAAELGDILCPVPQQCSHGPMEGSPTGTICTVKSRCITIRVFGLRC